MWAHLSGGDEVYQTGVCSTGVGRREMSRGRLVKVYIIIIIMITLKAAIFELIRATLSSLMIVVKLSPV